MRGSLVAWMRGSSSDHRTRTGVEGQSSSNRWEEGRATGGLGGEGSSSFFSSVSGTGIEIGPHTHLPGCMWSWPWKASVWLVSCCSAHSVEDVSALVLAASELCVGQPRHLLPFSETPHHVVSLPFWSISPVPHPSCSMTSGAQQALRRTMEIFSNTTRFALACNTSTKVSTEGSTGACLRLGPVTCWGMLQLRSRPGQPEILCARALYLHHREPQCTEQSAQLCLLFGSKGFGIVLPINIARNSGGTLRRHRALTELACPNVLPLQVIEPIQSRCAIVRFTKVSNEDILSRLQIVSQGLGVWAGLLSTGAGLQSYVPHPGGGGGMGRGGVFVVHSGKKNWSRITTKK